MAKQIGQMKYPSTDWKNTLTGAIVSVSIYATPGTQFEITYGANQKTTITMNPSGIFQLSDIPISKIEFKQILQEIIVDYVSEGGKNNGN